MKIDKDDILQEYIYVRLVKGTKNKIKECAKKQGFNMTIWARHAIMKQLQEEESNTAHHVSPHS